MIETRVYRAPSGQWSWVIEQDGEDVVRGAGYSTKKAATADAEAEAGVQRRRFSTDSVDQPVD